MGSDTESDTKSVRSNITACSSISLAHEGPSEPMGCELDKSRPDAKRVTNLTKTEQHDIGALRALRLNQFHEQPYHLRRAINSMLMSAEVAPSTRDNGVPEGCVQRKVTYWRGSLGSNDKDKKEQLTGRAYAHPGCRTLQSVWARMHATLAQRIYQDIDIANATPTMALAIADGAGKWCPALKQCVEEREEVLACLQDVLGLERAEAKQAVISTIFGSQRWLKKHKMLRGLGKEMGELSHYVKENMWKGDDNSKRNSALARYIFDLEHAAAAAVMLAHDVLLERGWEPDVLIFDGMLVRHGNSVGTFVFCGDHVLS